MYFIYVSSLLLLVLLVRLLHFMLWTRTTNWKEKPKTQTILWPNRIFCLCRCGRWIVKKSLEIIASRTIFNFAFQYFDDGRCCIRAFLYKGKNNIHNDSNSFHLKMAMCICMYIVYALDVHKYGTIVMQKKKKEEKANVTRNPFR